MRLARRIAAILLLTLWLPATLHCDLEAAGFEIVFVCHDHETQSASDAHCADDACHTLEGTALKAFTLTKLVGNIAFTVVALLAPPLELPVAAVHPERADVPQELGRMWQFAARAAPPVRAPACIA